MSPSSRQYHLACPTCKAQPFDPCRSLTKGRLTDTHAARLALYVGPSKPYASSPDRTDNA